MAHNIIDLLNNGCQANRADKFRHGSLIRLPREGKLIITGDIHGHRRNFERIITFANLENNPDTHLILQEIIHGGTEDDQGGCLSYQVLFSAIEYKLKFPDRIHFLMGNHDTAFINDKPVMKDGREMHRCMIEAIRRQFQENADQCRKALREFLISQPLAVRCENRIWISHSLPSDRQGDNFNRDIFDKELTAEDIRGKNSVYLLTWGRNMTQPLFDKMAKLFDADLFVLGHQSQIQGWTQVASNAVIITSEHNHGCLLHIDLEKDYNTQMLIDSIVPLASIS